MPERGRDYPGDLPELRAWFPDDDACLDYLAWLRWGSAGFLCHLCGDPCGWQVRGTLAWMCQGCRRRISPTAGTIFASTRTPLTVWFEAGWWMTSQAYGASALGLQRVLGLGSYQTAWTMLHKYRSAMVVPGRSKLTGAVEVDEVFVGGSRTANRGRSLGENQSIVLTMVERFEPRGFGRCRLVVIPDATSATLRTAMLAHIDLDAVIHTDAWAAYREGAQDWDHRPVNVSRSGRRAHEIEPGVSRVASQFKRWLGGTLQGAVQPEHLQAYCHEFEFRWNRRRSRARGLLFFRLLQQSVETQPLPYKQLVKAAPTDWTGREHLKPTPPNPEQRSLPLSLDQPDALRPWRRHWEAAR